jgi:hypothetical protein
MNAVALAGVTQPYFEGDVVAKWLRHDGDDRLMELRQKFSLVDSAGNRWTAPRGFTFDGTTIPRALWTVFGDPFIGDYRRAAVIHDLLCTPHCSRCGRLAVDGGRQRVPRYVCGAHPTTRLRYRVSSGEAASIFFEAMRIDGVPEVRAAIMRRVVEKWGPQFTRDPEDTTTKTKVFASGRCSPRTPALARGRNGRGMRAKSGRDGRAAPDANLKLP